MQHEHHRVPVTALALWNYDVLLAGSGSTLSLYNPKTKILLQSVPVFEGQTIHGILVNSEHLGHVLVWGGQYLRQFHFSSELRHLPFRYEASEIVAARDWILDAAVFPGDSRRAAIITAHNSLTIATGRPKSLELDLKEVVPGSNCILYCAQVTWLSHSSCLIASGTAFGDIIVWTLHFSQDDLSWKHQTHYSFSAHDGSVFGVQISSPEHKDMLGGRQRVLASCSDDRTVRLWDISDLSIRDDNRMQRETGFGSTVSKDDHMPTCLAKQMGHISRIWQIRFVRGDNNLNLLSFGEDATCVSWTIRVEADSSAAMKQVHVQKAHDGKNIWSVAVRPGMSGMSDDSTPVGGCIVTGGADGAIAVAQVDSYDRSKPQASASATPYRAFGFISSHTIVAITDLGSLELLDLRLMEGTVASKPISTHVPQLRGYSAMASIPGIAFFAGKGEVYYYTLRDIQHHILVDVGEKVASLFAQEIADDRYETAQCSLLVTTVKAKAATWYLCKRHDEPEIITITDTFDVELPHGFVVTSFVEFAWREGRWMALGSRSGCVAIYDLRSRSENARHVQHLMLYPGVHGKEAVTALLCSSDILFSTGRDGTYAAHIIESSGQSSDDSDSSCASVISLRPIHQLSLPLGPNIETLTIAPDGNIWVCGFRGKQFVIWDTRTQDEVMVVECGGAHRSFAFQAGTDGGTFVWTKASELHYEHQSQRPYCLLDSGGHGREIKASAMSPINSGLVATGAEDTNIKLHVLDNGRWRCVHTLQKHITGIQHLQWSEDGTYLFSSGGVEELYVWRISHDVSELGIGVLCESIYPFSTASDLRIMNFDARNVERGFHITIAYSNSAISKWQYRDKTWKLLANGDYLTSCLTQCLHLSFHDGRLDAQQEILYTASTDGHLVSWSSPSPSTSQQPGLLTWHTRHKVHQNAILSLTSHNLSPDRHILITGGDDNALALTLISSQPRSETSEERSNEATIHTLLIPQAHAAAVTALQIVRHEGNESLWFVSGSIDQRIKLWKVEFGDGEGVEGVDIALKKNVHTAVADVSSMELVGRDRVLVCGVGMDLWRIDWERMGQ